MARRLHKSEEWTEKANRPSRLHLNCVIAAFLVKLAKHLAVFTCLLILGQATGRVPVNHPAIFLLVTGAVLAHAIGNMLQLRLRKTIYWRRNQP
ncbi:MAG TPA: hypothetical protein VMO00_16210 [Methylomirabilota bacterium]|jgi:hypothetical protein|nr:hypothetical protein [Methylomirabilota bacterium]